MINVYDKTAISNGYDEAPGYDVPTRRLAHRRVPVLATAMMPYGRLRTLVTTRAEVGRYDVTLRIT